MALSKTECVSYVTTAMATVALVLFVGNAWMVNGTQSLQRQLGERQAQLQNGAQVNELNNQLVRALGTAVISKKDEKIKTLLKDQGITVSLEKPAAAPAKKTDAPAAAE